MAIFLSLRKAQKKLKLNKEVADIAKKAAIEFATFYANVACPFITYHPKMSKEIK